MQSGVDLLHNNHPCLILLGKWRLPNANQHWGRSCQRPYPSAIFPFFGHCDLWCVWLFWILEWQRDTVQLGVYVKAFQIFVYEALQFDSILYLSASVMKAAWINQIGGKRTGSSQLYDLKPDMSTPHPHPKKTGVPPCDKNIRPNWMPSWQKASCMTVANVTDILNEIAHRTKTEEKTCNISAEM